MRSVVVMCGLAVLASAASADEAAVKRYRNYTPQQIADMPAKVRESSVPMMYVLAARTGMSKGSDALFAMHLNSLMYPGVHDYAVAVRQFQRDLGDPADGVLTVWQIHQLIERAEMQKLSRISFPDEFSSMKTDDFALVKGTFVILDDRIAYPVNHARVYCWRGEGQCRVEQIYLDFPDETSWAQMFHVQQFDPEFYKITSWGKSAIDAIPATAIEGCRTTTMNLNFATKEFYQITRNTERACEVLGEKVPKLERPRISKIVDGEKIIQAEFAALKKQAFDVLSKDFRKKLDSLLSEEPKQQ